MVENHGSVPFSVDPVPKVSKVPVVSKVVPSVPSVSVVSNVVVPEQDNIKKIWRQNLNIATIIAKQVMVNFALT